ncbi:alpha,alpha-trehalase TreF [Sphingopyxis panaciterrae]
MPKPRKTEATPAELYGPLLACVQERGILADGKTFVDAVPLRPIADIMADFERLSPGDEALRRFVDANFRLPARFDPPDPAAPTQSLRAHIRAMWSNLARDPQSGAINSSALPVGHRHVVPGGRFREIYYWDSFFTMLGLVRDGEIALATGIVDALTDLIEDHGHVPNGTRTYYLGRSQPPLFHMMVALLDDARPDVAARRLAAMKREHAWWMEGAEDLAPGMRAHRVARLADGSLLNRYWDPRGTPRDESWREDVETATGSGRPAGDVYRDLRAGAESGWDFSSRWLEGTSLSSIRTTAIAPIDLNAFLFGLETAIAACGDSDATLYAEGAERRREAVTRHLWNEEERYFGDYDLELDQLRPSITAAALAPLLAGLATGEQADATARATRKHLLAPGGLRTTLVDSGQQWDSPNGWAPLQWIAVAGLRRYGHPELAQEIARRWVATVEATYLRTGLLYEKYDVESPAIGRGGEYAPQIGFGWTNGVTADLIDAVEDAKRL